MRCCDDDLRFAGPPTKKSCSVLSSPDHRSNKHIKAQRVRIPGGCPRLADSTFDQSTKELVRNKLHNILLVHLDDVFVDVFFKKLHRRLPAFEAVSHLLEA
jgi:hypothetical protein